MNDDLTRIAEHALESGIALRRLRRVSAPLMSYALRGVYRTTVTTIPLSDLQDLLENAFVDALVAFAGAQPRHQFSTYLVNSVRWSVLDYVRSAQFQEWRARDQDYPLERVAAPTVDLVDKIHLDSVCEQIQQESPDLYELFRMVYEEGYTTYECARLFGISQSAVVQRLHRVTRRIREMLEGHGEDTT